MTTWQYHGTTTWMYGGSTTVDDTSCEPLIESVVTAWNEPVAS
jgi:hypothetical protein